MIFQAFGLALGQLGDGRFQRVLWFGLGLTIGLLGAIFAATEAAIGWLVPDSVTLPWIGSIGGIDTVLGWAAVPLILVASIFLMVPVASAFCGLFLDNVADAVEDRHYPALAPARGAPLAQQLWDSLGFLGLVIVVNVAALIVLPFTGPLAPILFWAVNGYLLGREYFTLVALRRMDRDAARALRQRHNGTIWLAGALMAAPLSVPVVNLLVPVLGAATFTHLFHRLQAQAPSRR